MKNLNPYKDDCFSVHKNAVEKKHSGELKDKLLTLNPIVEIEYATYLKNFKANMLARVVPNSDLAKFKEELHSLFNYQSKVIRQVRESIKNLQVRTIISTCQNCTVDSVNTLDHILPQAKFPEFVVNPKNLFPCCSTCNSYKLDAIEADSGQKFLNLYLDELPNEQYLFVEIETDSDGELDFNYFLKNVDNKIDVDLFNVIVNHYSKLRLFERFKLKSIEYVSELESKISAFRRRLSVQEIISDLTRAVNDEKNAYGSNHWKCILELSLINSNIFMDRFR